MNRLIVLPGLIAGLVAAAILLSKGWAPADMTSDERISGETGASMAEVRLPAELSADARLGETAFDAYCAECHGKNAAGRQGMGPPLVHEIYEPAHHGDMAFRLAAKTGVRAHHWAFGSMPPVEEISESEIDDVTLYIRELQRENGIN